MSEPLIRIADPEAVEARIGVSDLLRFGAIIERVVALWHGAAHLAVGETQKLTTVKVELGGGEYEWDMGSLKKTK